MTDAKPDLRRLSQLPEHEDPHRLAELFRSAKAAPEKDLPRLRWRLRVSLQQRAIGGRRLIRIAVTAGTLFLAGGVLGAVVGWHLKYESSTPPPHAEPSGKLGPRPAHRPPLATAADQRAPRPLTNDISAVEETSEPIQLPAGSRSTGSGPVRPVRSAPPSSVAPSVARPPSPVAIEHALLGDALRSLRQQRDPKTALALLDEHTRRFPDTVLTPEVAMLRAEALLGLGRNAEALSQLDRLTLASMPNQGERFVLRGELRAAVGRWSEARDDFDEALALGLAGKLDSRSREVKERALWGRGTARSHLGDVAGSRADLAEYLRAFPEGRFARRAAQ